MTTSKELLNWLKESDASFKDVFTILWWSIFNHKKADILIKCYESGMHFWGAMKTARSGKFQ